MDTKVSIYDQLVDVTNKYLGPASDRFVANQVRNHTKKSPEKLQKHELARLIDWFGLSMALLSEDTKLVNKYIADLKCLAEAEDK